MKMIVVAFALVAVAVAAPPPAESKIVRSEFEQNPEGNYKYSFETEDGTAKEETGEVKQAVDEENKPHNVVVVRGFYSYVDPEGKPVSIQYYADENGFHAEGDSIPKEAAAGRR